MLDLKKKKKFKPIHDLTVKHFKPEFCVLGMGNKVNPSHITITVFIGMSPSVQPSTDCCMLDVHSTRSTHTAGMIVLTSTGLRDRLTYS